MLDLTAIVLTYNEEEHIGRCLRSLQPLAKKIYVVDSFSGDQTIEQAKLLKAETVQHPFSNQAQQFNWALDTLPVNTAWTMRIDADEYLESDLQRELPNLLEKLPLEIDGIYLKRKVFFQGKWIRYGGFYPHVLLRIWRTGKGRIEQRWMDEHIVLPSNSKTVIANGHLVDDNQKGITFWINKHNKYASREAVELLNLKYELLPIDATLKSSDDPQAKRKRLIKENLYSKLPLGLRSAFYFFYRYFLMFGFLDGGRGFLWHFLQGFWYRLLVDIKVKEVEERSGGDVQKMKEILEEEHGLKL